MAKLKDKYPYENFYSTSILRYRGSQKPEHVSFPPLPDLWGIKRGSDFLLIYASALEIRKRLDRPDDWTVSRAGPGIWIGSEYKNVVGKFGPKLESDEPMKRYIDADGDEVEGPVDILISLNISPESDLEAQLERLGYIHR